MVINYDFPQSAVSYIHRIGRTGRAGRHGEAVTLFTESDMDSLRSIANVMRLSGCEVSLRLNAFCSKVLNARLAESFMARAGINTHQYSASMWGTMLLRSTTALTHMNTD